MAKKHEATFREKLYQPFNELRKNFKANRRELKKRMSSRSMSPDEKRAYLDRVAAQKRALDKREKERKEREREENAGRNADRMKGVKNAYRKVSHFMGLGPTQDTAVQTVTEQNIAHKTLNKGTKRDGRNKDSATQAKNKLLGGLKTGFRKTKETGHKAVDQSKKIAVKAEDRTTGPFRRKSAKIQKPKSKTMKSGAAIKELRVQGAHGGQSSSNQNGLAKTMKDGAESVKKTGNTVAAPAKSLKDKLQRGGKTLGDSFAEKGGRFTDKVQGKSQDAGKSVVQKGEQATKDAANQGKKTTGKVVDAGKKAGNGAKKATGKVPDGSKKPMGKVQD